MSDDLRNSDQPPTPEIDTSVPHSARIWNYWLGGKDNYLVDQAAGDAYSAVFPGIVEIARHSRAFLGRSIRHLAGEAGVGQFLDVGTGLPTVDNTHEIAQAVNPRARIVYVDNDPLVLVHARALLVGAPEDVTRYVDADIRETDTIVTEAAKILDFTEPIGLILSGIMGHVTDYAEARSIVARLLDALPSGSYLSLNEGTSTTIHDADPTESQAYEEAQSIYNQSGAIPYILRTPEEISSYFDGLELVEPGVVSVPGWRPEIAALGEPLDIGQLGGVGRKP